MRRKAWQVVPQIGVSRFRIDLGIVHPDRPGDYLLGVECDGATYHSAVTARDRDKVRSTILQGLGWKLLRVWSTDWWVDKEGALERLHAAINEQLEISRALPPPVFTAVAPIIVEFESEPSNAAKERFVDAPAILAMSDATNYISPPELRFSRIKENNTPVSNRQYRITDFADISHQIKPALFYSDEYDSVLRILIDRVMVHEAPILDSLLVQRIARAHSFGRSGRLIRERVLKLVEQKYHLQIDVAKALFIWQSEQHQQNWACFRRPATNQDIRAIEEITTEELKVAASSIFAEDQALEVARLFGVRRLSNSARKKIEEALLGD